MIAVPFIYFTILLLYQLHKNKWHVDIACYILGIYAISAFFSILIDLFDLRSMDTRTYTISPFATFAYCGLISMCTWPFMISSNLKFKDVQPIHRSGLLKFLAWLFFAFFFINLVFSLDNIINVISSDDMGKIRQEHYNGNDEETWMSKLPFTMRLPFTLMGMMSGCSWIFIFLGFYCITVQKMSRVYALLFLVASLNGIISNINTGGRSAVVFWMIGAIACYLLFQRLLDKKHKRVIKLTMLFVSSLLLLYMVGMTLSRFDNTNEGTEGGLIYYFGISYINFCYFFDTFDCPLPTLQILFPLTYKLLGSPIEGGVELQEILTFLSHKELGTFYTFIGQIITTSYNFVGVLFCLFLFWVSMIIVKKARKDVVKITILYSYFLCSSVLFLGLFGHYYSSYAKTSSIIIWLLLLLILRPRKMINKKYTSNEI